MQKIEEDDAGYSELLKEVRQLRRKTVDTRIRTDNAIAALEEIKKNMQDKTDEIVNLSKDHYSVLANAIYTHVRKNKHHYGLINDMDDAIEAFIKDNECR